MDTMCENRMKTTGQELLLPDLFIFFYIPCCFVHPLVPEARGIAEKG